MIQMRLIDADKMKYSIEKQVELIRLFDNDELTEYAEIIANGILQELDNVPTVDAVEVIRCKDCKRFDPDTGLIGLGICEIYEGVTAEYGFCHHGKRKDGDSDDE